MMIRFDQHPELFEYQISTHSKLEEIHSLRWDHPWNESDSLRYRVDDQFQHGMGQDIEKFGEKIRGSSRFRVHRITMDVEEPANMIADYVTYQLYSHLATRSLVGVILNEAPTSTAFPEIWILEAGEESEFVPFDQVKSVLKQEKLGERESWKV